MNAPALPSRLSRRDCAVLVLLCLLVHGFALVYPRGLTTHEAVHCQNVREMFAGGDWLIPHYGGRPWLERPPLPHWLTGLGAALAGTFESDGAMRLGPLLAGCATVLLTGWMASVFFGRGAGLLAGAVLATMREFVLYAKGAEADVFLCFLVTAALALFVRYEFVDRRRRVLLAFFVVAGLTNWTKGPLFGTVFFVAVPMALYFLWNADGAGLRRVLWPWGLLVYAGLAAAWPLAAYLRHPDVVELWFSDFGDRWSRGYIGEPAWYYLAQWPWNVFPWTLPAVAGLWLSARPAFREGDRAARWLWCCGVAPVLALSLPQGKHHHYLLSCQPAWAVLGALGAVRLWRWLNEECRWRSRPGPVLAATALAGDAALLLVRRRLPGADVLLPWLLIGWPACVAACWWAFTRPAPRRAALSVFTVLIVLFALAYVYRAEHMDSYRDDTAFLRRALGQVPDGRPLLVLTDRHPLDASWFLFYSGGRARLLHNMTFLRGDDLRAPEVYVIGRGWDAPELAAYGKPRVVAQSRRSRGERFPQDRWTLYRVRFHEHLARCPSDVHISPMQATGRAPGPFLNPTP